MYFKLHYSHYNNINKNDAVHIVDHRKLLLFQTRKLTEEILFSFKSNIVFVNILTDQILRKSRYFSVYNLEMVCALKQFVMHLNVS